MFKTKDEENLEPFGGIVGQLEIFGEVGEVNTDISIFVGEVVVADEILVVEHLAQQGTVLGVHLYLNLIFYSVVSGLVIDHFQDHFHLFFRYIGGGVLKAEILGEGEGRYFNGFPLEIAIFHDQGFSEVGRINKTSDSEPSLFVFLFIIVCD